jgi:peroxiredoxin
MNGLWIVGIVLAWLGIVAGGWLSWQLLRQNGRLLLRLEDLEKRLNELEFGEGEEPAGLPVGLEAPEFELTDLAGDRKSLAQYRGQPLLLIFFNPACGFCRELLPKLTVVAAGFQPAVEGSILLPRETKPPNGARPVLHLDSPPDAGSAGLEARLKGRRGRLPLQMLIVSTGDAEGDYQLFREHQISCPVLLQRHSEVATAYQVNGTPGGYLIDREGKIASELAMGAEALLALAAGKFETRYPESEAEPAAPEAATGNNGHERESRFRNHSLARSKIKRDGLKAGTPAPDFRLPRLDGHGDLGLADLRGRRVFLVFSSPHCGPCLTLAPHLEDFHRAHPEVEVVMISKGEPKENRAKVKEYGLTFPVVLQQQWEVSRRYAMFATPIAYLIDEAGVISQDVAVGTDAILNLVAGAGRWVHESEEVTHV